MSFTLEDENSFATGTTLRWSTGTVTHVFAIDAGNPVRHLGAFLGEENGAAGAAEPAQPLVEILAIGHGHAHHNLRHTATAIGARLRYTGAAEEHFGELTTLVITQHDPVTELNVRSVLRAAEGVAAIQTWTELHHRGDTPLMLQAVSSFVSSALARGADLADIDHIDGVSEWLAEGRWRRTPVRSQHGLVDLDLRIHQSQDARSRIAVTSQGTWSSGERMPCGILENRRTGSAWAWQIEHNGGWQAELSERVGGELALGLFGPTDTQHHWVQTLEPGARFHTVPVSVCFASAGWEQAAAALTDQRRALRREREVPTNLPVIFNDYMNTLMGDPTTAKLLPLIDAAAEVGAEYFCIDAGWYDDGGDWWDSVGEWQPSSRRFPEGLAAVLDHIRASGMVPGLWLEPEVIGVRSAMVDRLPSDAFLQRHGVPLVEQGRLMLDLRHREARAHLDAVVDRLVGELGVGYFKFDYNVTPGQGTDREASSPGAGLLAHNRAHLDWLDDLATRHPALLVENCASGAQRADYAMLSRLHLQSTSDQQDPMRYPPVAAAAPLAILPEQAANWAYPQPGMSEEEIVFTLATAMLGRLYLSGRLDQMSATQRDLVRSAVAVHREIRSQTARSVPIWPLGLPGWTDPWMALGARSGDLTDLTIWHRDASTGERAIALPHLAGSDLEIVTLFPGPSAGVAEWETSWSPADAVLRVCSPQPPSARVLRLHPRR